MGWRILLNFKNWTAPITHSFCHQLFLQFKFGASSMQGWRKSNEDAHITAIDFVPDHSLFAVFDGHGGSEVAKFCGNHFVEEIKNDASF